jgi:hypothetical protein
LSRSGRGQPYWIIDARAPNWRKEQSLALPETVPEASCLTVLFSKAIDRSAHVRSLNRDLDTPHWLRWKGGPALTAHGSLGL